ncbi:MAG: hypothetical protein LBL80_04445 [Ruminococcus sp.]|jgi:hypothetical protein|nr:hypothetical protein [Ruminococcus sp.]
MDFYDEKTAIEGLADFILRGGVSMYNTMKYIYSLAERDYYNVNIKDVIKLVINNVTDVDSLSVLGLRADGETVAEMETESYRRLLPAMVFSLAVRTPALKPVLVNEKALTDDQIYKIYSAVMQKGGANTDEIVPESFLEIKYLVKKQKPLPPFTADWYKNYIFKKVPELSAITNKNIFLLGASDIFFGMFYACFLEALSGQLEEYVA